MPHVEVPQADFKVVMLGDTFTGKTSLVVRFAEGFYRDSLRTPTVGASFITKRMTVKGVTCKIQIWDTAGQEQFKVLAPMYYKNAAAAIVCYDSTSPRSFETLQYWVGELQKTFPTGDIILALCATKCDLDAESPDTTQAEAFAQEVGAMFMRTSSKDNLFVSELFVRIAEQVLRNKDIVPMVPSGLEDAGVEGKMSSSNIGGVGSSDRIGSPVLTATSADKDSGVVDEKKEDREVGDLNPSASMDSSAACNIARCDNMLMCGDSSLMGENGGQSCCIQ
eukprot:Nitzschia sp. Nitz4//scaffold3_size479765//266738//267654//NITZ4_000111-RA/size479765-snap-gene-1.402-mRNA-1//-1//CDS//3329550791//4000//frame0